MTIATPFPSLWVNLIAPQPATPLVEALRGLALAAAAVNTVLLVGLIGGLRFFQFVKVGVGQPD